MIQSRQSREQPSNALTCPLQPDKTAPHGLKEIHAVLCFYRGERRMPMHVSDHHCSLCRAAKWPRAFIVSELQKLKTFLDNLIKFIYEWITHSKYLTFAKSGN